MDVSSNCSARRHSRFRSTRRADSIGPRPWYSSSSGTATTWLSVASQPFALLPKIFLLRTYSGFWHRVLSANLWAQANCIAMGRCVRDAPLLSTRTCCTPFLTRAASQVGYADTERMNLA